MKTIMTLAVMVAVGAMSLPALARGGNTGRVAGGMSSRFMTGGTMRPSIGLPSEGGLRLEMNASYDVLQRQSIFDQLRSLERGPETRPGATEARPVRERLVPVFRGALIDDVGSEAIMEVPVTGGGTTIQHLREGATLSWDQVAGPGGGGGQVMKVVEITLDRLRLMAVGGGSIVNVPIGYSVEGVIGGSLPSAVVNRPGETAAAGARSGPARGRGPAPTGARSGMRGGPGAGAAGATFGVPGVVTASPLDPPLPEGSADDMAGRLALRRQRQLDGSAPGAQGMP